MFRKMSLLFRVFILFGLDFSNNITHTVYAGNIFWHVENIAWFLKYWPIFRACKARKTSLTLVEQLFRVVPPNSFVDIWHHPFDSNLLQVTLSQVLKKRFWRSSREVEMMWCVDHLKEKSKAQSVHTKLVSDSANFNRWFFILRWIALDSLFLTLTSIFESFRRGGIWRRDGELMIDVIRIKMGVKKKPTNLKRKRDNRVDEEGKMSRRRFYISKNWK